MDPLPPPPSVPPSTTVTSGAYTLAAVEPQPPHNHTAHPANAAAAAASAPSPSPPVSQSVKHPPYPEMIYAAITALKERDGSSKRAIAKYIETVYPELPSTHSVLLTHHLKRLKNNGLLVMVKKSYKLPRSDLPNDNNNNNTLPTSTNSTSLQHPDNFVDSTPGPKRGRGRPPKPKPKPIGTSLLQQLSQPISQQPVDPSVAAAVQPVFVALGLTDEPNQLPKRSPGRPKNVPGAVQKNGRGRPPKTGLPVGLKKKSPGRPKKPKSISGLNGVKRGRGRPPKNPAQVVVGSYATGPANVAAVDVPRPRGRPRKLVGLDAAAGGVGVMLTLSKRPGRPPKVAGVNKHRKSSGRPVGRPKKNANASMATSQAPHGQAEGYLDLKRKLEFFQARLRQAVGVLKAQVNTETEISAIAAIQELEGLAAMDVDIPWMEEPEPAPPVNQLAPPTTQLAPAPMPQH